MSHWFLKNFNLIHNPNSNLYFRSALDQAMSHTYIRDGFNVILTKSQKDSMRFLSRMTNTMKKIYNQKCVDCEKTSASKITKIFKFKQIL